MSISAEENGGLLVSRLFIILGLLLVGLLLYYPTLSYDFAYDDVLQITHNPLVSKSKASLGEFISSSTPPGNLYRPVPSISYYLNFKATALNASSYHLLNVLLYCLVGVVIFLLAEAITNDTRLSGIIAIIFVVHPIHVEAVANIIGRAELFAALFGAGSFLLSIRAMQSKLKAEALILGGLAVLSYLLACLSKESAFTIIGLLIIPLFSKSFRSEIKVSRLALLLVCYAVVAALVLYLRAEALGDRFVLKSDGHTIYSENPLFHQPFSSRFIGGLYLLGRYTALILMPLHLSADYSVMPAVFEAEIFSPTGYVRIGLAIVVISTAILLAKRTMGLFLWFYLITFALTLNIVTPIGTLMGERLAFLPSFGLIGGVVYIVLNVPVLRVFRNKYVLACVLVLLSARSWVRIPVWENNSTLFLQTVKDSPNSPKAFYNLAVRDFLNHNDPLAAKASLLRALELNPDYLFALRLMADVQLKTGDAAGLKQTYQRILKITPGDQEVLENLKKVERLYPADHDGS